MFRKIIGTIFSRGLTAILALATWTLAAHYLGPARVGTIGLIIFSVTIIQLFTNFLAGGAVIYMTPRAGVYRVLIPATVWTFAITFAGAAVMWLLGRLWPVTEIIPQGYFWHVLVLAWVISFNSLNLNFLLGLEKVKLFNMMNVLMSVLLIAILSFFLFVAGIREVMAYYWALLIAYSVTFAAGSVSLIPFIKKEPLTNMKTLIAEILRFGSYVQVANFFQTMNYRLSLKFVDLFHGRAAVGVLNLGLQLAEGLWLISRSLGIVQYSRLSNEMNYDYSVKLTLTLAKISWLVTAVAMGLVLAIPGGVFAFVFSRAFGDVKMVIASLSFGIVALSVSMIFSGFFSGINKPYHNTISSGIGLVFTIGSGLLLIPRYGIIGAGFSATLSYTALTLYQFIVFSRMTKLTARDFLLTKSEIKTLILEVKKVLPLKP